MRLAGSFRRAAAAVAPPTLPLSSIVRGAAALAVALIAACGGDSLTAPTTDRLSPTPPDLTLTGGAGVQIFPTVPTGETQPVGVAVGLNDAGQVTGSEFGLVTSDLDFMPFRWTPGSGAVRLVGCCDTRWGNDINDAGTVVGTAQTSAILGNHAWVATGTTLTTLPALAG